MRHIVQFCLVTK